MKVYFTSVAIFFLPAFYRRVTAPFSAFLINKNVWQHEQDSSYLLYNVLTNWVTTNFPIDYYFIYIAFLSWKHQLTYQLFCLVFSYDCPCISYLPGTSDHLSTWWLWLFHYYICVYLLHRKITKEVKAIKSKLT